MGQNIRQKESQKEQTGLRLRGDTLQSQGSGWKQCRRWGRSMWREGGIKSEGLSEQGGGRLGQREAGLLLEYSVSTPGTKKKRAHFYFITII